MKQAAIIYGGQSPEHEVSLRSAINALKLIEKVEAAPVMLIRISFEGTWSLTQNISDEESGTKLAVIPGIGISVSDSQSLLDISLAYLFVHGTNCEDGTLQSILLSAGIPYTGSEVLSSALCMSKSATISVVGTLANSVPRICADKAPCPSDLIAIPFPLIVKPEASGSSVGITIIHENSQKLISKAFEAASRFSPIVIFEQFLQNCREFECGIVENDEVAQALRVCELSRHGSFLSYDDKYHHGGDYVICPADIDECLEKEIQSTAIKIFRRLGCSGYARVDFLFDTEHEKLFFNEVNTLPGFTQSSHFPKMLQASGVTGESFIHDIREIALKNNRSFSLHSGR